jgi:hypothetical protein
MSDSREPNSDLGEDRDILHFLTEGDSYAVLSGGDVPEGVEGPYQPSVDEFVEGARCAAEANRVLAEAWARISEEQARMLFQRREGQR